MHKIAFVCSGNTCRSPMAEGMFNAEAMKRGLDARAVSCGLSVGMPRPASEKAVLAAGEYGADISGHFSQPATVELLSGCDKIYGMTGAHVQFLKSALPDLAERIEPLAGRDVADPYGGGQAEYDRAAEEIWRAVSVLLEEF